MNKTTIHWLGAGLSSLPGLKTLAQSDKYRLIVWVRDPEKVAANLTEYDIETTIHQLDWQHFTQTIGPGDIVVSMLPATEHVAVARLCLTRDAHFVSSSYISPEMANLNEQAKAKGLCFVNEVGLDPGIDHLFAHLLVDQYRHSDDYDPSHQVTFRSYCGGVPNIANDFKYKFSWSPLGVLKALKSPSKWIENGQTCSANAPWESLREIFIEPANELFEAYPNRDSLPFIDDYQFDPDWPIDEFVRGTLRLSGWSSAWQSLFEQVKSIDPVTQESKLRDISEKLEQKYAYQNNEADRVVLFVQLTAKQQGTVKWQQSYFIDEVGNEHGQAMARLVSLPVLMAIDAVVEGTVPSGVTPAPREPALVNQWLDKLAKTGIEIKHTRK
ncbi:saccharopine dehydrogenase family protein [Thalassotalea ganghwensis]